MLAFPGVLLFSFAPSLSTCLIGFTIVSLMSPVHVGPLVGVSHSVVKVGMRSFSTSVIYLISELLGLGFGTVFIGAFNDHYGHRLGVGVIRYSMATAAVTTLLGGLLFLVCRAASGAGHGACVGGLTEHVLRGGRERPIDSSALGAC